MRSAAASWRTVCPNSHADEKWQAVRLGQNKERPTRRSAGWHGEAKQYEFEEEPLSQPGGDERGLQPGGDEWSLELARILRAVRRGRGVVEKQPDHMKMAGVQFEEELEQTMAAMTRRRLRVSSRIVRPSSGNKDEASDVDIEIFCEEISGSGDDLEMDGTPAEMIMECHHDGSPVSGRPEVGHPLRPSSVSGLDVESLIGDRVGGMFSAQVENPIVGLSGGW